jgi:predicted RND superfamily exporter protein
MAGEERAALIKEIKQLARLMFKEFKLDITGFDELVRRGSSLMIFTQIQSLGLSVIIIFGMMMLVFGFRGGLATIPPNIFPIAFMFSLMGHAHFYLNLATVTIAAIALGLIIDDTIHYFSHFKYEFEISGKKETAMKEALKKVGGALCYTSLILTSGFLIFLFSETAIYMDFAILSSAAVVTALIGDLIIAPALLTRVNIFKRKENIS